MTINPRDISVSDSVDPVQPFQLRACPHLGTQHDPDTVVSFPSNANCCFRFKKPVYIQLSDQEDLCLSGHYEDCHIFQNRTNHAGAPTAAAVTPHSRRLIQRTLAAIVMLMLIILAALLLWPDFDLTMRDVSADAQVASPASPAAVLPIVPPTAAPTTVSATESESPAPALAPASSSVAATAVPTAEPTAVPAPAVDLSSLPDLFEIFQTGSGSAADAAQEAVEFDSPIEYGNGVTAPALAVDLVILRPRPNLDGELTLTLSRRELLTMLGRDTTGDWVKVRSESGLEGWVNARESNAASWAAGLPVIATTAVDDDPVSITTSLPVVTLALTLDDAALRAAPGTEYAVLGELESGRIVGLLGSWHGGPWVRVRLDNGQEGWIDTAQLAGMS